MPEEFVSKLQTKIDVSPIDYYSYFKPSIEKAIQYAIGPYFWFIPDNRVMKIIAVSENIRQLTPYSREEWIGKGPDFLAQNVHPDDRYYFLAATAIGAEVYESNPTEKQANIRVNIYCRILNADSKYRCALVQYVAQYYNSDGKIESTLGLITDLSSFEMLNKPMMTIIDNNNKECQFFKVLVGNNNLLPISLPKISKREQEIIQFMAKGLKTPDIANVLNISYHTVENHKRNLRKKTNTKTSAELVHFVMKNCLL